MTNPEPDLADYFPEVRKRREREAALEAKRKAKLPRLPRKAIYILETHWKRATKEAKKQCRLERKFVSLQSIVDTILENNLPPETISVTIKPLTTTNENEPIKS